MSFNVVHTPHEGREMETCNVGFPLHNYVD